jgi:hypothetical protein
VTSVALAQAGRDALPRDPGWHVSTPFRFAVRVSPTVSQVLAFSIFIGLARVRVPRAIVDHVPFRVSCRIARERVQVTLRHDRRKVTPITTTKNLL